MSEKRQHDLQLAFVLHSRSYRETSLLLDLFTLDHGRIGVVARGVKRGKSKLSAILQPFTPLQVSWYGNGDLVTLTHAEQIAPAFSLVTKQVICGLYVNELLIKLLHKWDPYTQLFADYQTVLQVLACEPAASQAALRKFEKQLLKSIGYGLQLTKDIDSGTTVVADLYYVLDPVLGPRLANKLHLDAIRGSSLLALSVDDYSLAETLADAKHLMRIVFAHHLGSRALMARELL